MSLTQLVQGASWGAALMVLALFFITFVVGYCCGESAARREGWWDGYRNATRIRRRRNR